MASTGRAFQAARRLERAAAQPEAREREPSGPASSQLQGNPGSLRVTQHRLASGARRTTQPLAAARVAKEAHGVARGGACPGRKERADTGTLGGNMPNFLLALQTQSGAAEARARVQEQDLRQWGLTGQWPRAEVSRGPSATNSAAAPPEDRPVSSLPADLPACPSRHCGGAERRGARLAPGGHCPPPAQRGALADAG